MAKSKAKKTISVAQTEQYLSPDDLLKCETLTRDITNAKLAMHLEEQALRNMLLESELLKIKIEKQKELLALKSSLYDRSKNIYNSYVGEMWPKYGIDPQAEKIGYDDTTGKIIK